MTNPLITIGIPFYKPQKSHLLQCIRSVFAQTYSNWELLVVDDGSNDSEISKCLAQISDPRVRVFQFKENLGLSTRLNFITAEAKGELIARLDADDFCHPDRIASQVNFLLKNPSFKGVTTLPIFIDLNGDLKGVGSYREAKLFDVFKSGIYLHPSLLAYKTWFSKYSYDRSLRRAEDRDLFVRTKIGGDDIFILKKYLYFYRWSNHQRKEAWLQSYKEERQILIKYGFKNLGVLRTDYLLFRSVCKSVVLNALYYLNLERVILKSKFSPVDKVIADDYAVSIQRIADTSIPGVLSQ